MNTKNLIFQWVKREMVFKRPSGTSRGVLNTKPSYFIKIFEEGNPSVFGLGECSLIKGLSIDPFDKMEVVLNQFKTNFSENHNKINTDFNAFPSIQFGIEMALLDLKSGGTRTIFPNNFSKVKNSIDINGLVWMGDFEFMNQQIQEKLETGFKCIKLKIGAIDFDAELKLIAKIRKEYAANEVVIRVDANGAFAPDKALEKLKRLSEYDLHSIEQPIRQKQWEDMAELCAKTPLPIALDEELIGYHNRDERKEMLDQIKPQYIILKPSLVGGFKSSEEWIALAEEREIGFWITSALEANIGLNAIAQWTFKLVEENEKRKMYQGLGTGKLFNNNIESPLEIVNGQLQYLAEQSWNLNELRFE